MDIVIVLGQRTSNVCYQDHGTTVQGRVQPTIGPDGRANDAALEIPFAVEQRIRHGREAVVPAQRVKQAT